MQMVAYKFRGVTARKPFSCALEAIAYLGRETWGRLLAGFSLVHLRFSTTKEDNFNPLGVSLDHCQIEAIRNPFFTSTPPAMELLHGCEYSSLSEAKAAVDALSKQLFNNRIIQRSRPSSLKLRCCKGSKFKSQRNPHLPAAQHYNSSS
ncbi:hypothetical protein ACQKWADRAFT_207024 [Trichoderma austrokoningii]